MHSKLFYNNVSVRLRRVNQMIAARPLLTALAVVGLAIFAPLPVARHALAQNLNYARFQYGNASCGEFLKSIEEYKKHGQTSGDGDAVLTPVYASFMSYMWGFLSGSDYFDASHFNVGIKSEVHSNSRWLENYCRSNPLDRYQIALEYLRSELTRRGQ